MRRTEAEGGVNVVRYRKPLVNGDAKDVHGAVAGSSRDRWCSRQGGPGLSYNHHLSCFGRVQVEVLLGRPGGDMAELIVGRLDVRRANKEIGVIGIFHKSVLWGDGL